MSVDNASDPPFSGWVFVLFAAVLAGAAWFALTVDLGVPESVGVALLAVAGFLATVGAVAVGVEVGVRRASR